MQVILIQCHRPTPWNFLHALTAFKSIHTVKPKNTNNFMTKHFLTFKQFYLSFPVCTVSISAEVFDDLLSLNYSRHFGRQFRRWNESLIKKVSSFPQKHLFEVQFLMTCDTHLTRGDYPKLGSSYIISTNLSTRNWIVPSEILLKNN